MKRKKSANSSTSWSIECMSFEKRETMRPVGVTSKKERGARITEPTRSSWSLRDARRQKCAMHTVRTNVISARMSPRPTYTAIYAQNGRTEYGGATRTTLAFTAISVAPSSSIVAAVTFPAAPWTRVGRASAVQNPTHSVDPVMSAVEVRWRRRTTPKTPKPPPRRMYSA